MLLHVFVCAWAPFPALTKIVTPTKGVPPFLSLEFRPSLPLLPLVLGNNISFSSPLPFFPSFPSLGKMPYVIVFKRPLLSHPCFFPYPCALLDSIRLWSSTLFFSPPIPFCISMALSRVLPRLPWVEFFSALIMGSGLHLSLLVPFVFLNPPLSCHFSPFLCIPRLLPPHIQLFAGAVLIVTFVDK